jgi:hypothetical protein
VTPASSGCIAKHSRSFDIRFIYHVVLNFMLEIMLAAPGIAWKESEMSIWLLAYKESLYAHETAHGIDME